MKILVQSDDFGFTKSIVDGASDAFIERNGIITCTGLFANMPDVEYAISKIKDNPQVCFGIDINVVSGPCVADKKRLPTLVNQKTGYFIQTSERIKDPRWGQDVFKPYDECYIEACAQVEQFIELVGRKPEYLTSHSTNGSKIYLSAIRDVAHYYGIKFSYEVYDKYNFKRLNTEKRKGDFYSYENQTKDKIESIINALEAAKNEEYVLLGAHCGYVDADIIRYSRCNIERAYDHEMLVSEEVQKWIKDNNAELISYRDLD